LTWVARYRSDALAERIAVHRST